jgi:glycerol kinase
MSYYLAIDQGTTGTTACLVDAKSLQFIDKCTTDYRQIYPAPGLVEHNLDEIWASVESSVSKLLTKNNLSKNSILSIGLTNQRETICAFNRKGEALYHALVWQDRRMSSFCEKLKKSKDASYIRKKTGLTIDPYFSASKIYWLMKNVEKVKNAYKEKNLLFGTIDTFLLYKLSGHLSHATDYSNASRTLVFDIEKGVWDKKLCDIFQVPTESLPVVQESFSSFGKTKGLSFLADDIPITGILGDQQSALFGQAGFKKGSIKCTYGTGAFMLMNTGTDLVRSKNGLLTTIAYKHKNKIHYALEGSCYIAGAAVQWLRDNLKVIKSSADVESLAKMATEQSTQNVLLFPFFAGIGSPHWKPEAKAALIGLSRDSGNAEIARATLEGIALSINDLYRAMLEDTKLRIKDLRVDGGAAENNFLMQLQANFCKTQITRPKVIETTAYGAVLGAAIGKGELAFSDLEKLWKEDLSFKPVQDLKYYKGKQVLWDKAIKNFFLR